jgi:hypothetical protein
MKTYPLEVCISVEIPAPSLDDAKSAIEDVFGVGELEGLDIDVTSFDVKEK